MSNHVLKALIYNRTSDCNDEGDGWGSETLLCVGGKAHVRQVERGFDADDGTKEESSSYHIVGPCDGSCLRACFKS